MARRKKKQIVSNVEVKGMEPLPIYFDPNSDRLDFHIELNGERFVFSSHEEAYKFGRQKLKELISITWRKVIRISFNEKTLNKGQNHIDFSFHKFMYARTEDGVDRLSNITHIEHNDYLSWSKPTREFSKQEVVIFPLKIDGSFGKTYIYHEYTDELWFQLCQFQEFFTQLEKKIHRMFESADSFELPIFEQLKQLGTGEQQ